MKDEEKYDLIERYLANKLEGETLINFEKQLQNNQALQQELELHRDVANNLQDEKMQQLRQTLQSVDNNWQAPTAKPQVNRRRLARRQLLAVAAIGLLTILAYRYFSADEQQGPQELFATYYEPYPMVLSQRSETEEGERAQKLAAAINYYEQGDYLAAADLFRSLQVPITEPGVFYLYTAVSDLAAGNAKAAIPQLETLYGYAPTLYIEQARWYLALAYLLDGNLEEAKIRLNAIQAHQFKYEAAVKLLEQL